jgi:Carboxypeptidase regulatory-like domain/Putative zinc-finger
VNRNLQLGVHPDADKISVFVEGAATAREKEKMLAHLAECAECRKAVFLMQPREEPQRVTATPERGWMWRWLVPVGLPAAALACGLIAVLVYIRPHGVSKTPQQMASITPPETERAGPTAAPSSNLEQGAPTANADRAPSINSEQVTGSGRRRDSLAAKAAINVSPRQERPMASGLSLPTSKSEQATANVAPQKTGAAPSVVAGPVTDAAKLSGGISTVTVSELPLNGRSFTELQQLQPADTKGAASQNALAEEKERPALQIQAASAQNETLAGISGRIIDRSGAVIAQVTVTLRDATGKKRQSTTSTDGSFQLMQLPAGQYELTATASGFKTSQQSIELKPSELAMLQPVLDVGAASEVVEVEAGSSVVEVQTESANANGQAVAEMTGARRAIPLPSGVGIAETVSHGKRFLSLDDAGNVFLSRNGGKEWKKVKPQWAGRANRIELTSGSVSEAAAQKPKDETSGAAGEGAVFLLTTDGGTVWSSKDGAHWHRQ